MNRPRAYSWLASLALGALLAAGIAGPTATAGAKASKVTKIAIATPEKAVDYGWNQQGVQAARAAAAYAGATLTVDDGIGYDNTEPVLSRLARDGANLIIAQASGYNVIAPRVAARFNVPMITYDSPQAMKKGLVADIETSSQEGAYLAGVLAAKTTKTGTVAVVISAADTNWFKQTGGFVTGARSVRPKIKVLFTQIGQAAYEDAAGGKRVAQEVIAGGADVVFGNGDGSSFGYLQAVETAKVGHKVWFIDVIGNKTPIDKRHVLLSSVLWDFRPIFTKAVNDINNGTFGTHNYNLNDATGISLLKTPYISEAVWSLIERDRAAISAGKIKIPLTPTEAAVNKILK